MPKTVKEKNDEKVKEISKVLVDPYKSGFECAFRGMAKGEGIILDDDKLKTYQNELGLITKQIDNEAEKRAMQQVFGKNTPFKHIWNYKESTVPKKSPDVDINLKKMKEIYPNFIQAATIEARRKNDRHELKPNQKVRLPETNDHFQHTIKKIASDMAMQSVLGVNTPYESYSDYVVKTDPSRNYDEAKKYAPSDYEEKEALHDNALKQFKIEVKKEMINKDPSLKTKAECLLIASEYHQEEGGKFGAYTTTWKYTDYGFLSGTTYKGLFEGDTETPELGNAIKEAIKFQYPVFDIIPMSDYNEQVGGILSYPHSRLRTIKQNQTKAKYFTEDAQQKGFEQVKGNINGNRLPFGWYQIQSNDNEIIISQPFIYNGRKTVIRPELLKGWEEEKISLPSPIVRIKKDNDKWIVEGFLAISNRRIAKKQYTTKDQAKDDLLCFTESYEDTYAQMENKLTQKAGDVPQEEQERISSEFEENVREKINMCRVRKHLE